MAVKSTAVLLPSTGKCLVCCILQLVFGTWYQVPWYCVLYSWLVRRSHCNIAVDDFKSSVVSEALFTRGKEKQKITAETFRGRLNSYIVWD